MGKELKPFDKILVRNSIMGQKGYWIPAFYGAHPNDRKFLTSAGWQDECIPYEGNEEYLGTNKDYVCRIFPELKESEDEKIRKEIIYYFRGSVGLGVAIGGVSVKDMVSWLEKQGEQKPAWSEEDEKVINDIIRIIDGSGLVKSIREHYINKLKSLRPQSQWKPSEEMLEALYRVIPENVMEISEDEMLLDKLYQGLKYGRVLSEN